MTNIHRKRIIGAALGNCVHVAGLSNFLQLAEQYGYETLSLGPAVPIARILEEAKEYKPEYVGLSYRLTPESMSTSL